SLSFFLVWLRPPPGSALFPYTTLFRSRPVQEHDAFPEALEAQLAQRRRLQRVLEREVVEGALDHRAQLRLRKPRGGGIDRRERRDRKSTRLNSSHVKISYAVFCLKKKN